MAYIHGLRGRYTVGDAAVVDALRKLVNGDLTKVKAHDVWTTAVADITTAPHPGASISSQKGRRGSRGKRRSIGHQGDPMIDGMGAGPCTEVFQSLKWQPMPKLDGADPFPETFVQARMWPLGGLLKTQRKTWAVGQRNYADTPQKSFVVRCISCPLKWMSGVLRTCVASCTAWTRQLTGTAGGADARCQRRVEGGEIRNLKFHSVQSACNLRFQISPQLVASNPRLG